MKPPPFIKLTRWVRMRVDKLGNWQEVQQYHNIQDLMEAIASYRNEDGETDHHPAKLEETFSFIDPYATGLPYGTPDPTRAQHACCDKPRHVCCAPDSAFTKCTNCEKYARIGE